MGKLGGGEKLNDLDADDYMEEEDNIAPDGSSRQVELEAYSTPAWTACKQRSAK